MELKRSDRCLTMRGSQLAYVPCACWASVQRRPKHRAACRRVTNDRGPRARRLARRVSSPCRRSDHVGDVVAVEVLVEEPANLFAEPAEIHAPKVLVAHVGGRTSRLQWEE